MNTNISLQPLSLEKNIHDYNINVGELLLQFAHKSQDVFWIKSPDYSQQIYLSPSYENIWERDSSVLINNPNSWIECIHPEDRNTVADSLEERKAGTTNTEGFFLIYRIITPSGKIKWIKDESFPIHDHKNKHIAFAGIAQEITKEKELEIAKEEARIANNAKSEFLANVSHDLRTPLNWLLGSAEILKKTNTNTEQSHLFNALINGGNRIKNMVNSILDYSRLELKMPILKSTPIDLREIIEESLQMHIGRKSLKLIVDYPDKCESKFNGDKDVWFRIFNNLLDNAFKFTHSGFILVKVSEINKTCKYTKIQIRIEDSGIGIPKDKLDKIFDKFEKVEPSYKNSYQGIGLGLTIIKKFITALSGDIIAKSIPSQGSQFILTVPFLNRENKQIAQKSIKQIKLKILIFISPDKHNHALKKQLEPHDCTILIGQDSRVHSNTASHYDLILINLPSIQDAYHAIKKQLKHIAQKNSLIFILYDNESQSTTRNEFKSYNLEYLNTKTLQIFDNYFLYNKWLNWYVTQHGKKAILRKLKSNILVVEDHILSQKVIHYYLTKEFNCTVKYATSGKEALICAQQENYDLIFMDIGLPDMSGIEATKQIHTHSFKNTFKTPIVALTAHANTEDKTTCYEAGMIDFISKPVSIIELEQVMYQHLIYC